MGKMLVLYAILIFAKRAPKMISELLNIKGDNLGLKGLSIKNKMGEAALVGDKVKAGMNAVEGGVKQAGGAAWQALKAAKNTATGNLKGVVKSGIDNAKGEGLKAWRQTKNSGFMNRSKAAGAAFLGQAKANLWGKDGKEAKKNMKNFGKDFVANAGDDGKKIIGNLVQGANDYRKKEDTKGAFTKGRTNTDINYLTPSQRFEKFAGDKTRQIGQWAGLDTEDEAKKRYDRAVLGMPDGNGKIKIDADFHAKFPEITNRNIDGFTFNNGATPEQLLTSMIGSDAFDAISTKDANGNVTGYDMTNIDRVKEHNQQYQNLSDENKFLFDMLTNGSIINNGNGTYSYDQNLVDACKQSSEYLNLSDNVKLKFDEEGLMGIFNNLGKNEYTYSLDADKVDKFKKGELDGVTPGNEYKLWDREKQLTFDKVTNSQMRDDLNTLNTCLTRITELTSAIANAQASNSQKNLSPGQPGYIDTGAIENQLKILNKRVDEIDNQNYKYAGRKVDVTNIESAMTKVSEDISKNSSDMAELKASQKPKNDNK